MQRMAFSTASFLQQSVASLAFYRIGRLLPTRQQAEVLCRGEDGERKLRRQLIPGGGL